MKKLNCKVLLLEISAPNHDLTIYKQTQNVFGDTIHELKLEYSTNPTYNRNISLINERKAATNDESKYKFYALYFVSDREIKEGDYYRRFKSTTITNKPTGHSGCDCKLIEATTDASLNLPLIPESFIEAYIAKQGDISECEIELNEDGTVKVREWSEDYLDEKGYVKGECIIYNPAHQFYTYAEVRRIAKEAWGDKDGFEQWWDSRN